MNKIFHTAAAAALLVNSTPIQAQEETPVAETVEINPKHFKFQGIEFYPDWQQANIIEDTREASFVRVVRKAALFKDTKTSIHVPMSCEGLSAMIQVAQHTNGPKKFIWELQKGEDYLGCPKGPLI